VAGLLVRIIALALVLVQAALVGRLLLPFVASVPRGLRPFVPPLVELTDTLVGPFQALAEPFHLSEIGVLPDAVDAVLRPYVDRVDPAVIVAMIGWSIGGAIVLLLLRVVLRPR
jgi:hypothetical protein